MILEAGSVQILLSPEVTYRGELLSSYLRQITAQVHSLVLITHVEDAQGMATIGEGTQEYLDITILHHTDGLLAQDVLVDSIHFMVAQKSHGELVHLSDVATDKHIAGHEGPQRDVGVLFVGSETAVTQIGTPAHLAHDEHVGIIPMSGLCVRIERSITAEAYVVHALPSVGDIACRTP